MIMKKIILFIVAVFSLLPLLSWSEIEANFPNQDPRRPTEPQKDAQGSIRQKSVQRLHQFSPDIILRTNNIKAAPALGSTATITPIIKKNGSVTMSSVSKVYLIWYGNWIGTGSNTESGKNIINNLIKGLANTTNPYVRVTTDKTGSKSIGLQGPYNASLSSTNIINWSPSNSYVFGSTLSDANVQSLVIQAITANGRPDPNAIYLVLTSSDVNESSGFCSKYCGWHTYSSMTVNGVLGVVKYGFIGNPDRCITACAVQTTASPNNLPGIDGMASIIAHEMEEIVTDPLLNNWYNSNGYENADMCAWTFGNTTLQNGSYFNVDFGAQGKFLLQRALGTNSVCYTAAP